MGSDRDDNKRLPACFLSVWSGRPEHGQESKFSPTFGFVRVARSQLTQGVEVLVAGQIVADDVVGLPASKQGEARPDLHLH